VDRLIDQHAQSTTEAMTQRARTAMKPRAITDDFVELHNSQEARFCVPAAWRWWQIGHFMKTLLKKK
jgi:hypothetical protein